MSESQVQSVCVCCGGIADDVHHGRHHDLSQGKGAGGTRLDDHEHFEYLPLCRIDHDRIHAKELVVMQRGDVIRTETRSGELMGERAVIFDDERYVEEVQRAATFAASARLLPFISDEGLSHLWEQGQRFATQGYLYQCIIANAFHERYQGWGNRWYERAAEIIGASARTVYDRWRAWGYLKDAEHPEDEIEQLGKDIVQSLGQRAWKGEDVAPLADQAMTAITQGTTRGAAAKALRDHDDEREPKCQREGGECVCRYCGAVMA